MQISGGSVDICWEGCAGLVTGDPLVAPLTAVYTAQVAAAAADVLTWVC